MRKVFTLRLIGGLYKPANLCFHRLNGLFDLDDRPKYIDVVVSDKPLKNSYLIKTRRYAIESIVVGVCVKMSDDRWLQLVTSAETDRILKTLPDIFYVSVMA